MPEELSVELDLGGRLFRPAEPITCRQWAYMRQQVKAAGLSTIEWPESAFDRLVLVTERLLESSVEVRFRVLAASLTENGGSWTEAGARELARWFGDLTDTEAIDRLDEMAVLVVLRFFGLRGKSSRISRAASPANATPETSVISTDGPIGPDSDSTSSSLSSGSSPVAIPVG